jgi:MFS transporter, DHA1 family, multidrug resistance protein
LTSFSTGISEVITMFGTTRELANFSFTIMFLGIAFAPVWVPHATERFGRAPVYLATIPFFALFTLGVSEAKNVSTILVCRFFSGFFGGPSLVLIEGTFADIWSAETTVSYYSVLSLASYTGAAAGKLPSFLCLNGS